MGDASTQSAATSSKGGRRGARVDQKVHSLHPSLSPPLAANHASSALRLMSTHRIHTCGTATGRAYTQRKQATRPNWRASCSKVDGSSGRWESSTSTSTSAIWPGALTRFSAQLAGGDADEPCWLTQQQLLDAHVEFGVRGPLDDDERVVPVRRDDNLVRLRAQPHNLQLVLRRWREQRVGAPRRAEGRATASRPRHAPRRAPRLRPAAAGT